MFLSLPSSLSLKRERRVARSRGTRHSKGLNIIRKAEAVEASRHGARKCTRLKITWMNVGWPFRASQRIVPPPAARKVSPLRLCVVHRRRLRLRRRRRRVSTKTCANLLDDVH